MTIKAIFLDAANTLVHKPELYPSMLRVLRAHGIDVSLEHLARHHRFMSEATVFPDRTSRDFYVEFNSELLRSLGVFPTPQLLDELFNTCSYLRWEAFADVAHLTSLKLPLGVLSNWNTKLPETLSLIPGLRFTWVLGSEQLGLRKPDPAFYGCILEASGLKSQEIIYVGDSMRLDVEPALKIGFMAALIDRDNFYMHANVPRLTTLSQISSLL